MLIKLAKESMYTSNLGWLESRFHFSFAEYKNPENVNFGVLRVLNDDIIHKESGFDTHPHHDMEIISYIVNGEITHKDSMGNTESLKRGEVQYLSAGTGMTHSEFNKNKRENLRLLQIWILPPKKGLKVLYGSHKFTKQERENKLLKIVSSLDGDAKIKIYQDVNIFVCELEKDKSITYALEKKRQIYYVQIEGTALINGIQLDDGDGAKVSDVGILHINAQCDTHFLFIEMKKE